MEVGVTTTGGVWDETPVETTTVDKILALGSVVMFITVAGLVVTFITEAGLVVTFITVADLVETTSVVADSEVADLVVDKKAARISARIAKVNTCAAPQMDPNWDNVPLFEPPVLVSTGLPIVPPTTNVAE